MFSGQNLVRLEMYQISFFVTNFISFVTCTCYRYKTFTQYQKKKERKEKAPAKEKVQY